MTMMHLLILHIHARAMNHFSSFRPETKHISAYLSTETLWELSPKEYGALVHIYAKDGNVSNGYHGYRIRERRRQRLKSQVIQEKLTAAEANYLGKLGKGALA